MSRFSDLLKRQFSSESRSDRRAARVGFLDYCKFEKIAQEEQHGILQHFRSENRGYPTRDQYHTMRGVPSDPSPGQTPSDSSEMSRLYGVNPEHKDSELLEMNRSRSLSTRYSPDRVGVQARRVSDGVWQDPYTNRTYDYNDGFTTESGEAVPGGHVALQSHMIGLASHLDSIGLHKEADYLDGLIKKANRFTSSRREEDVLSVQDLDLLYKLYAQREGIPYDPDGPPPEKVAEAFRGLNKESPMVKELLGVDSGDAIMFEPDDEPSDVALRPEESSWFGDEGDAAEEEVDYGRAVAAALQLLRSISRSAPGINRRNAYEIMEVIFEQLSGEDAVDALNAEKAIIDETSRESGSGRGFLG